MTTWTRQYGRRGPNRVTTTNTNLVNSGGMYSNSSTGITAIPPRRYVLDVPTGRTVRTSHISRTANRINDDYDDTYTRSRSAGPITTYSTILRTDINNENAERFSRSGSREYYYQDGASTGTRYFENSSVKQITEPRITYTNTINEDQEVQALTTQATPNIKNYPINVDSNPDIIIRPNTQRLTYTQDIGVRYLRPHTPPPPGVRFFGCIQSSKTKT